MERESLLTVLAILLGGAALQVIAAWLSALSRRRARSELEGAAWLRLWRPLVPALTVVAGLCGWALAEPDPVPNRVGPLVFIVCAPFALLGIRALVRAVWALLVSPADFGIATVGLLWLRIKKKPKQTKQQKERAIQAALAHERAHVRHLDPLRIWIAQFMTDLQWPWASAQRRFETWLAALEQARDDEARAEGVEGSDLAAALVASIRFHRGRTSGICAPLTGDRSALEARIERLLQPLEAAPRDSIATYVQLAMLVTLALLAALGLGHIYGKWLVGALLALS